ncbi:MAG: iron ABC transporter permease [Schaedlerella sp.]|nr:iron ABC transporter permease [Schaedlerella sp.]
MSNLRISSIRNNKKVFVILLTLLTLFVMILSIMLGSVRLTPHEILTALAGNNTSSTTSYIVLYSRLPRTFAALLAGTALSVSGVVIQTVLNNPLASPGVIGVNSSAGFAVALVCALIPAAQKYTPFVAFFGALAGILLVMGLSLGTKASKITVVLAGMAISNLFSAGIDTIITFVPDALNGVTDFRIGGFSGVIMEQIAPAAKIILPGLILILTLSPQLDILSLGSDIAKSLGLSVGIARFTFLVLSAALAGAAVSFSGLLGFIGLIIPHAMRRLVGEESLVLILTSALGGGSFVMFCDLLARTLFSPFEIPVGIVLAFTGGPFFLWLLFKQIGGRT